MLSSDQIIHSINHSTYRLDLTGVVGLFGGDSAVDALETIHLYAGRRWAGWYNYPGTVTVAKRFGQMAEGRLWDSLFPGPNESPAVTFNLAGKFGPDYSGSFSGTKLRTGYPGYLMAAESAYSPCKPLQLLRKDTTEARKTGSSATVAVVSLPPQQRERIRRSLTPTGVGGTKQRHGFIPINPKYNPPLAFLAIVPSLISILASVICFLANDPLCASLIILGIVSSGFSSLALGSATLNIRVPIPSAASPPGDGLMLLDDGSIIVLKGEEADVNVVTKGEFELDYSIGILPHPKHHIIGFSSLLLMTQFLVQLLILPRCTFFGQILFLISFVASGAYHLYVVSHERESLHREILSRELSARMENWTLGTRTQMAVFVCLLLGDGRQEPLKSKPNVVLSNILPNDTPVWTYWRRKVLKELERFWNPKSSSLYVPSIQAAPEEPVDTDEYACFTEQDKMLLGDLVDDAWCVFNGYSKWRDGESGMWKEQGDGEENLKAHLLREASPV
ncbi:hypothetical protein JVT61DRAFT_1738 [Boletus reticuloceps]|uniref:Uncharacterized protein n=1 Tax=Boletus reticuloceps TaxID=495285 RepID=A0A8I2YQP9_9AGAM|nr:hypothetical protein JVT61DRAFT_1738 [Boletus reticuloceps]